MTTNRCTCCGKPDNECECWEFPGWGKVERIVDLVSVKRVRSKPQLGPWRATAICGNDITSSCLYVSALAALYAGPLALLLVAGVLFLFRNIYSEVGSALPLNGGAYNLLLNTTKKAVEYVIRNEQIRFMEFVWFYRNESEIPQDIDRIHEELDHQFPMLHIDFVLAKSELNSDAIRSLAKRMGVPCKYIFVTSRTASSIGGIAELGGARIVL